nr:hypothetical protein BaRGS_000259 [Batillaria attramentaria]
MMPSSSDSWDQASSTDSVADQVDIDLEFSHLMGHRWQDTTQGEPELYSFEDFVSAESEIDNYAFTFPSSNYRVPSPASTCTSDSDRMRVSAEDLSCLEGVYSCSREERYEGQEAVMQL